MHRIATGTTAAAIDVWFTDALRDSKRHGVDLALLDSVEIRRYAGFSDARAAEAYAAAHLLARRALAEVVGIAPGALRFDRTCERCGGPHGRPVLRGVLGVHVSLARTGSLCAVAVTTSGPVGIDIERIMRTGFDGFPEVALHPEERTVIEQPDDRRAMRRTVAWVRKEAALKALGTGLGTDLASVLTPPSGIPTVVIEGTAPVTVADLELEVADGHVAAVAVAGGPERIDVTRRGVSPAPTRP